MFYQKIAPCEPLKTLVSHYWVASWDVQESSKNSTYYTVANTLTDIAFGFQGTKENRLMVFDVIQGHTGSNKQFAVPGFNHLLGVSLFSHAIPSVFDTSTADLFGKFITAKDLLVQDADRLLWQLQESPSLTDQIQVLDHFFYNRLKKGIRVDERMSNAVQLIQKNHGLCKISELANSSCLSQKQFERRFKDFTGFNPKLFSRIVRFEAVVKSGRIWNSHTEAAHELGYHDQAHFIRDFRSFTGMNPREFWKLNDLGI